MLVSREYDKTLEKAGLVLGKDKDNIDARVVKASALAGKKEFKKALSLMEETIKSHPDAMKPYGNAHPTAP